MRTIRTVPVPLVQLVLLFGAGAGSIFAQSFPVVPVIASRAPFPASSSASFAATAVGDFDGDFVTDAAVIRGGYAYYIHDLSFDGVVIPTGQAATDIATLHPASSGPDSLLITGVNGLTQWRWSAAQVLSGGSPATGFVTTTLAGSTSAWKQAKQIFCGDIDGDGDVDIVGVASNGLSVVTLLASGQSFTAGPTLNLPSVARRATLVDPTKSGTKRIAISDNSGVRIERLVPTGQSQTTGLPIDDYLDLEALPTSTGDRLAGLTTLQSSGQWIYTTQATGLDSTLPLGMYTQGVSLAVNDMTQDAITDLAMNVKIAPDLFLSVGSNASPMFNGASMTTNMVLTALDGLGGADANRVSQLVSGDMDHDGDPDLVFGDDSISSLAAVLSPIVDSGLQMVTYLQVSNAQTVANQLQVTLDFNAPVVTIPGATHVAIRIWKQPLNSPIEATSVAVKDVPIASGIPTSGLSATFDLPEVSFTFTNHYWVSTRVVTLSGQQVTASGPVATIDLDLSWIVNHLGGTPIGSGGSVPHPGGTGGGFGGTPPTNGSGP